MIMPRGEALLLPARTWFIVVTLLLGLLVNMLQNMGLWGNAAWIPDLLAVVLVALSVWCACSVVRWACALLRCICST